MNWLKKKILGMIRVELASAYDMLKMERENASMCLDANKALAEENDRLTKTNDILLDTAEHWRKEANTKQKLFSDIAKEVDGAENLHNLKQIVREMAFRNESYGAILCRPGEEPKVIVTDERVI